MEKMKRRLKYKWRMKKAARKGERPFRILDMLKGSKKKKICL